MAGSNPTDTK